ncbi:MAG: zinc-ribbon domain-containing protein, partial [Desulfobacterales bacterium]
MIVTCQECESSFNINDEIIKETGSKVKCSKCENIFVVYPEAASGEADFEDPLSGLAQEDELDDDLGLPDLDSMFEEDQESDVADLSDDLDLDIGGDLESDDLDIDIGEDSEAEDILSELDESAETDLPDIDGMMDFDEDAEAEELGEDIDDEMELDLDDGLAIDDIDEPEELGAEADEAELDFLDDEGLLDEDVALEAEDASDQVADELDLDAEMPDMDSATGEVESSADELDLSDLEDLIDVDPGTESEAVTEAASEDPDIELDFEAESVESAEGAEQVDELDLTDLEDTADTAPIAEAEGGTEGAAEELELDLEFEEEPGEEEKIDELDLFDLEETADADVSTEAAAEELDVELDVGAEPAEATAEAEGVEELDFSDLEDIVESDESPAGEEVAAASPEEVQSDLELDFDVGDQSQEPAAEATAEAADELDFSDLGKMLQSDEEPVLEDVKDEGPQEQELDLDFDVDLEAETAAPQEAAVDTSSAAGDEEFLDIEKMLEESEDEAVEVESIPESTDLDLDLDSALEESDALDFSDAAEDDLEFNLLESDEAVLQEDSSDLETSDFQTGATTGGVTTDGISDMASDFDTDEFTDSVDLSDQTDMLDDGMPMPEKQRSLRKPLTVFALFIILLGGVLIIPQNLGLKIPFLSDIKIPYVSDIKIPYLSDKFNPQPKDVAGNLLITPMGASISYQMVENEKSGQLFVVK